MNRRVFPTSRIRWGIDPVSCLAVAGKNVRHLSTVKINGAERKLSAGAWIKNENNTIDMPVTLKGRQFTVNYTEDNEGNVNRVWILSPAEASVPLPKQQ